MDVFKTQLDKIQSNIADPTLNRKVSQIPPEVPLRLNDFMNC